MVFPPDGAFVRGRDLITGITRAVSDVIIKVEGLGKRYQLGRATESGRHHSYRRFSDVLLGVARAPYRAFRHARGGGLVQPSAEEFWALRDICFEIERGDVVGIIGRNGAGKSTLLKILSRITEPTTGRIEIDGRVASLLEVGTGFHPELTGRENIYLNGAILGMSRYEVRRKFDEIVAFAEVEQFLDTPVKHYSSGMYVRLAFAVSAHMEPEILVIDEVLAVGDTQFQNKCLGKMQAVSRQEGRTVLFVSHNMSVVNRLCPSCVWLGAGQIRAIGATREIVAAYMTEGAQQLGHAEFAENAQKVAQYIEVSVLNSKGEPTSITSDNESFSVECTVAIRRDLPDIYFGLSLLNADGIGVLFADSRDVPNAIPPRLPKGDHRLTVTIPPLFSPGRYVVSLGIATTTLQMLDSIDSACGLEICDSRGVRVSRRPGIINLSLPWHHQRWGIKQ
jgi:lipopolysaccharide transport system ATP-binding protein